MNFHGYITTIAEELGDVPLRLRLAQAASQLIPQLWLSRLRTALYRAGKIPVGKGSLIMGHLSLCGPGDIQRLLKIGDETFITGPLRIDVGAPVRIGSRVNIGHDCLFLTIDHAVDTEWRRAGSPVHAPIIIEDGAWIASRVTILPGRIVGRGSIVATGAVVAADVPPHTMVGGVPAKVLRQLPVSGSDASKSSAAP